MAGRKTILNKEIQTALVEAISLGLKIEDACSLAGIAQSAFFKWIDKGEKPGAKSVYVEFAEAIKKAHPSRKRILLGRIYQAARGGKIIKDKKTTTRYESGKIVATDVVESEHEVAPDWKADAWMLERGFPDEFGRRYQVDVTDWRKQAEKSGVDPKEIDAAFNRLVDEAATRIARGDEAGGGAKGAGESGKT
jgi:hypothetical protein